MLGSNPPRKPHILLIYNKTNEKTKLLYLESHASHIVPKATISRFHYSSAYHRFLQ